MRWVEFIPSHVSFVVNSNSKNSENCIKIRDFSRSYKQKYIGSVFMAHGVYRLATHCTTAVRWHCCVSAGLINLPHPFTLLYVPIRLCLLVRHFPHFSHLAGRFPALPFSGPSIIFSAPCPVCWRQLPGTIWEARLTYAYVAKRMCCYGRPM